MNPQDVILLDKELGSLGIVVYCIRLSEENDLEYDLFLENDEFQTKQHLRTYNRICDAVDTLGEFEEEPAANGFNKAVFMDRNEFNETGRAKGFALPPDIGEFKGQKLRLYLITCGARTIILCGGFVKRWRDKSWQKSKNPELVKHVKRYEAAAKIIDKMIEENKMTIDTKNGGFRDRGKLVVKINLQDETCETEE